MFAMIEPDWLEFSIALVISSCIWFYYDESVRSTVLQSMRRFSIYGLFILTFACALCLVVWRVLGVDDLFFLLFVVVNVAAVAIVVRSTLSS